MVQIYHITHLNNLVSIAQNGLFSDEQRILKNLNNTNIGYEHIKKRRLKHPVDVCRKGVIGQYIPFNFCPRSVMLYVIHKGNTNILDGQERIIHLVSNIDIVSHYTPCFFTDRHADLAYAVQCDDLSSIHQSLNWQAIEALSWQDCKEQKQAEFLAYNYLPWVAITEIGVCNQQTEQAIYNLQQKYQLKLPNVSIYPTWYY